MHCMKTTSLLQLQQGRYLKLYSSQSQAMLPSKLQLLRLLDGLLSIMMTTSLLQLQQGRYLKLCSSQSQAMLPSKLQLSRLLIIL